MNHEDPAVRARAADKVVRWQAVIDGVRDGSIQPGSRTPVADTPAWVTLEVAHGGFATGRLLAERALDDAETALLARLPDDAPGATPREKLNLRALSDEGMRYLADALASSAYRIDVPEDAVALVIAWLSEVGDGEAALDLVAELRPWMSRLRFYPSFVKDPRPTGATVRVASVGEVVKVLARKAQRRDIVVMRDCCGRWAPLYDRLVALWSSTVEGALPSLVDGAVVGGWPCRRWPADWASQRAAWRDDYAAARRETAYGGRYGDKKSNFSRLRKALERCEVDSSALTGRDVGWIRRALANTITAHGSIGSSSRDAKRAAQARVAAMPLNQWFVEVFAARLKALPQEGGLVALESVSQPISASEHPSLDGRTLPEHLVVKARRALERPIEELVDEDVIRSAEVMAWVLPQITSQIAAAGIADDVLRTLFGRIYAAFRSRRSLLLVNLEHQVQLEELPWVAALAPYRRANLGVLAVARQTMDQVVALALDAFPQTILPNRFVRELRELCRSAAFDVPLLEELASDIFMGTFTRKWVEAGALTSRHLRETLYGRYYDLPSVAELGEMEAAEYGPPVAATFAALCASRAEEAHVGGHASLVAANGAVVEQSQILTTHNLAVVTFELGLEARVRALAPRLAAKSFEWIVRRQQRATGHYKAKLQMVKNLAYAWRQAIFFLSLCEEDAQRAAVDALRQEAAARAGLARFDRAIEGLAAVVEGERFDAKGMMPGGRRFLGWSVGQHWLLDPAS